MLQNVKKNEKGKKYRTTRGIGKGNKHAGHSEFSKVQMPLKRKEKLKRITITCGCRGTVACKHTYTLKGHELKKLLLISKIVNNGFYTQ